jgi:hypothetical protein
MAKFATKRHFLGATKFELKFFNGSGKTEKWDIKFTAGKMAFRIVGDDK